MAKYKLLIDIINPYISIGLTLLLYFSAIILVFISTFFPKIYQTKYFYIDTTRNFASYLKGEEIFLSPPIEASLLNREFYLFSLWNVKEDWLSSSSLENWSQEIKLNFQIIGCGDLQCNYTIPFESSSLQTSILKCYKAYNWNKRISNGYLSGFYTNSGMQEIATVPMHCDPLILGRLTSISYPYFRFGFKLNVPEEEIQFIERIYSTEINYGYSMMNSDSFLIKLIINYFTIIVTVIAFLISFLFVSRQKFFQVHLMQRFILILLFFQIFANDTLEVFIFSGNNFINDIVSIVHDIGKTIFYALLIFISLVFLNRLHCKTKQMTTFFYTKKILLSLFIFGTSTFLVTCFNPSFGKIMELLQNNFMESYLFRMIIVNILPMCVCLYLALIGFYFTIILYDFYLIFHYRNKSHFSHSFRFVIIFIMFFNSFIIFYLFIYSLFRFDPYSISNLALNLIVNLSTILLSIFFLPSNSANRTITDVIDANIE